MDICTMGQKLGEMYAKKKFAEKKYICAFFSSKSIFSIFKRRDKKQDFLSVN